MNDAALRRVIIERLKDAGLRPTRQRVELGAILWKDTDHRHISAEGLYNEAVAARVRVSVATVYNTLHQFTHAGLLREIVIEGGRSYFDTNTAPHHHFFHEDTGSLEDIHADAVSIAALPSPPDGTAINAVDVVIRVRKKNHAAPAAAS